MHFWFHLFRHLPLWALHAMGHAGGWLAWLLSSVYRRRFMGNARQAGYGWLQVAPAIGHAGAMSAELPRLWFGRPVPVRWADDRAVVEAYQIGQGVLFLAPHLGCFEITAQALAARFAQAHGPLTVLYRPARQPGLARVMASARHRPGLEAVPTNLAGVRQMIGYTVPTWSGYAGWGLLDYFLEQPGRFTLCEAFHANGHALVHRQV